MNAARYILGTLEASGVQAVFGLPGVHALGLWKAVEESGIRYVGFRHEHAAAHAADGYARSTGGLGAVLVSTGPGALNTLSALGEANVGSSAVVAIASNIPSGNLGLRKGYLHEAQDLGPAFAAVSQGFFRAATPGELPAALRSAIEAAVGGRPGAAVLEVASDLFDSEIVAEPESIQPTRGGPIQAEAEEAAQLLRLAARPVIWAGGGVLRSEASTELTALAEALGAPVLTTFMGKGAIPAGHPLSIGTLVRQPEAAGMLAEADLLLAVGTRFSGMSTGNWKLKLPSQLIQVDIDPAELGRNYPLRLGIVADAKAALAALVAALDGHAPADDGVTRAEGVRGPSFQRGHIEGPREMRLLDALRAAIEPDVQVFGDMTMAVYWAWPFFPVTVPGTFHSPYGYGGLGFALPAALGAAAASGDVPVVAIAGDGGFQYHLQELSTAAQYKLPVKAIVFNDGSWGVLRSFSQARYATEFGLDLRGPDFVATAEACGVPAERASTPEHLEKALRLACRSRGPRLIEVPGRWSPPPPADYYGKPRP